MPSGNKRGIVEEAPVTVTRMDSSTRFDGKSLWRQSAADVAHPDGRTEQQAPYVRSHTVKRTPWIGSGRYFGGIGWKTPCASCCKRAGA